MSFTTLSNLLHGRAQKKGLNLQVEAAMALEFFSQIVAKEFDDESKESMKPLYVRNSVLYVAVLAPVVAQEIRLHEQIIITKLNEKLGRQAITKIQCIV